MKKILFISLIFILLISFSAQILANGTRNNPYQMGERFTVEGEGLLSGKVKFEFELLETKRGEEAYNFVLEEDGEYTANSILEDAEDEEKEILIAKFFAKAIELEEEPYKINSMSIFNIMDSTGSVSDIKSAHFTNNPFGETDEVYKGGEVTGWITCLIKPSDSILFLVKTEGDPAFLKPKGNTKQLINLTIEKDFYNKLVQQAQTEGLTLNEYISKLLKNK